MNGLLANAGMTEKDIQFVNLPGDEMAGALAKGDVDAACVWQPLLDAVEKGTPGGKLLGTDMDTPNYKKFGTMASPDIMIISRKLVDDQPELARKLVIAIFKGVDYTNAHPEDTAQTVAHYFRKSPEEVLAAMKTFKYFDGADWVQHMQLHAGQMQFLAQWLYDNGKIASLPDTAKWENTSFVPKPDDMSDIVLPAAASPRKARRWRIGPLLLLLTLPRSVAVLLLWWAATRFEWVSPIFLPAPGDVLHAARLVLADGELLTDVAVSARRVFLGFGLAAVVAVPLGIAMGVWRPAKALMDPFVSLLRPLPSITWIRSASSGSASARRRRSPSCSWGPGSTSCSPPWRAPGGWTRCCCGRRATSARPISP